MRALVQRVSSGGVFIKENNYETKIGKGLVILLGIKATDTENDVIYVADKCFNLRIFDDENGKMNKSISDVNGEILVISQFTLYGDSRKGNRPSFNEAASPNLANSLYEKFVLRMKYNLGDNKVKEGIFGAMMEVLINNDGPVTILVESK